MGQPHPNCNKRKLYRFCFLIMSSITEKSPIGILVGEQHENHIIKMHYFVPIVFLWFQKIYNHISGRILFRVKLNIPFKNSHKAKSFGTKIITLGQCVNE